MLRAEVEEVELQAVDLGQELGQAVQRGLDLAPVVGGRPVAGQGLHGRQRHPLAVVVDRLTLGPAGRIDPPAQLGRVLVGDADLEGADRCGGRLVSVGTAMRASLVVWWAMQSACAVVPSNPRTSGATDAGSLAADPPMLHRVDCPVLTLTG